MKRPSHDYDVASDYGVDRRPPADVKKATADVARRRADVAEMLGLAWPRVAFVRDLEDDHLARYVSGTSSSPVVVLDGRALRSEALARGLALSDAVETTLMHELGHAYFDSIVADLDPDEEEAAVEAFAAAVLDGGADFAVRDLVALGESRGRRQNPAPDRAWPTFGKALARALSDHVGLMVEHPAYQCGWMDGGCFTAARAVARIVGGRLVAVESDSRSSRGRRLVQIEHVVVETPDGAGYLDGDGFARPRTMLERWRRLLASYRRDPSTRVRLRPLGDLAERGGGILSVDGDGASEITCDLDVATQLEERLRADLPPAPVGAPTRQRNPTEQKTRADLDRFLAVAVPAFVHGWLVDKRTVKQCGTVSTDFALVAHREGFRVFVVSVPGHFYNVVMTKDGPVKVDLSACQFEVERGALHDFGPEERDTPEYQEVKDLFARIERDPFSAVRIEPLPGFSPDEGTEITPASVTPSASRAALRRFDAWSADVGRRPNPAPRRPLPEGVESWFDVFGKKGAPARGERGHVDPFAGAGFDVPQAILGAIRVWRDPDLGPAFHEVLVSDGWLDGDDYAGEPIAEDDRLVALDELPDFLGVPRAKPEQAAAVLTAVVEKLSSIPESEAKEVYEYVEIAIVGDALDPERRERPRLVNVSKDVARRVVAEWHSALPEINVRGALYALGVAVGDRLVAVAVANTPSGAFRSRGCPPDGILELSRIASDGSTIGASSMLASRLIDLVPRSGRRGVSGCLFVTYSLLHEAGTTYLALADKGLRPVALRRGTTATGSRKKAGEAALRGEDKIVWEAGPAAAPPDWSVLERTKATREQIAGAMQAFYAFDRRDRKAGRGIVASLP